jgi:EAL domain-containing protein (putative c-di-GMP-specific phosphodiesterase class I)
LEAIVHWSHPDDGLLGPDSYLAVAEETGLSVALGRRSLAEVCRQGASWFRTFGDIPPLSLDCSSRLLHDPDFASDVARLLAETGLPPDRLQLELTEEVATAGTDEGAAVLVRLREIGVGLAIDHFGAGASHLAGLGRLPIESLKLDGHLITGIETDAGVETTIRALIGLGHALGLRVTADGIETAEQAELLTLLGCVAGQGAIFAPPLAAEAVAAWLGDGPPVTSGAIMEAAVV